MKPEQKEDAHLKLFRYVSQYTASHWGTTFVAELQNIAYERKAIADEAQRNADDKEAKEAALRRQGLQLTGKA
ncbi:hypothetical protein JCM5353_009044 [Sporobolomyces roseus]